VDQLLQIGEGMWIYEGSTVSFYGFPFPTRATIVRLANGDLWVHSPGELNDKLKAEIASLGVVKHLIAPNKLHHLFIEAWIAEYPHALKYAAPGLSQKRKDIKFDIELAAATTVDWSGEILQTIFRGSPAMEEAVFFHPPSKTLILTDLIENFDPNTLSWWQRTLASFAGILNPEGKMPIDWRLSFLLGSKNKARESLNEILAWKPDNIILSHGKCIFGGGTAFLKSSFHWLEPNL
jgi:hypothetical protein